MWGVPQGFSQQIHQLDYLQMPTNKRVPTLAPDGTPLMPTKASRARRWLQKGLAKVIQNDLQIFVIQLVSEPSGYQTQDIACGLDLID